MCVQDSVTLEICAAMWTEHRVNELQVLSATMTDGLVVLNEIKVQIYLHL